MEERFFKGIASYLIFPLLMGSAIAAFFTAALGHLAAVTAPLVIMIVLSLLLHALERVFPYRRDWNRADGQELNDLGHAVFGTLLGAHIGRAIVALFFPLVAARLSRLFGSAIWPMHWPLFLQVPLLFLIADFGRYWEHRLLHRVPRLWRFHALHHSAEKLTILKTYRKHLIERCFQSILSFGPLVALGAPPRLILYYAVPNIFLGLFSHSNVDLRLGYLASVINGPEAHRIHHSLDLKEGNTNFGSAIVLWDILFGSYTCPDGRPGPERLGIPCDPMPKAWLLQLLSPFLWNRIEKSAGVNHAAA